MITDRSTLEDVAFEICTALAEQHLIVVMCGGSAATFYAPDAYQSYDVDFVCYFDVDREVERLILGVLGKLGYTVVSGRIAHAANPFVVDFPKGPLLIADDERVASYESVHRGNRVVHVITPFDCVRDRLAKYFYWNDFMALDAAVAVAIAHSARIDLERLREWADALHAASSREGYDVARKFDDFLSSLRAKGE